MWLTFDKLVRGDLFQLIFGQSVFPESLPVLNAPDDLNDTNTNIISPSEFTEMLTPSFQQCSVDTNIHNTLQ